MSWQGQCQNQVCYLCYVQIPSESGHGQKQRVEGQERIQLIAIDYHAATGTAGMRYREDWRSKVARWPESGMDPSSLTGDTRVRDLGQSKRGQKEADKSNVDSEDTKYRKEILNTTIVEQRRYRWNESLKEVQVSISVLRERLEENVKGD